jgi:hypothetical protein
MAIASVRGLDIGERPVRVFIPDIEGGGHRPQLMIAQSRHGAARKRKRVYLSVFQRE